MLSLRSEVRYVILYLYLHVLSVPLLIIGETVSDNKVEGFPRILMIELLTFFVMYILVYKFKTLQKVLTDKHYTCKSISEYKRRYGYLPSFMRYSFSELIRESHERWGSYVAY
jgi:hypothetical protein